MTNLIRWEPAREILSLREAMDRLFNDSIAHPPGANGNHWQASAVDMYQTADDVVVKAALPGLKAEDVQISVTGDMLTFRGESKEKEEVKEKSYHIREQRWGMFERSIMLPTAVLADKARAEVENGVLTITLPKADEVKPKAITVKAK